MRIRVVGGTLPAFVLLISTANARQGGAQLGSWAPGYNHPTNGMSNWPATFEAINMAVIPLAGTGVSSNPGRVIVFDDGGPGTGASWPQRFAVGAPETGTFDNYIVNVPSGFGNFFCSGHVWMPNGRLFVAGGTTYYPPPNTPGFIGSKFVGIWDPMQVATPPNYGWTFVCDPAGQNKPLSIERWYPTVTLLGNDQIMVAGGVKIDDDTLYNVCGTGSGSFDGAIDTYEIWDLTTNDWVRDPLTGLNVVFDGPEHGKLGDCHSMFGEYPRQHLLSSGALFVVGMWEGANHVHQPTLPGIWQNDASGSHLYSSQDRFFGASVLVPNVGRHAAGVDRVMILGGSTGLSAMKTVEVINGYSGTAWLPAPSMNVDRMVANTVLLPDGAILEIGGCKGPDYFKYPTSRTPEKSPEIYRRSVNAWILQNPQTSNRMYHSSAALLPSGNVVTASGDDRIWDYEVFTPDYLSGGQERPVFVTNMPTDVYFDDAYVIQYQPMSPGLNVDRVVLMAPCSVTHHNDMHQRYVELEEPVGSPPPNTITVKMPPVPDPIGTTQGSVVTPAGWYMLFLISNAGTPSIAQWVNLQY